MILGFCPRELGGTFKAFNGHIGRILLYSADPRPNRSHRSGCCWLSIQAYGKIFLARYRASKQNYCGLTTTQGDLNSHNLWVTSTLSISSYGKKNLRAHRHSRNDELGKKPRRFLTDHDHIASRHITTVSMGNTSYFFKGLA